MRLLTLKNQTKYCKRCFKKIYTFSFDDILRKNVFLCQDCSQRCKPKFIHFKHKNINCLSIYEYDEEMKENLYKYKGCYDFELKDIFLDRYLWYLKIKYCGYKIICIPSYYVDDALRGFNHVNEIAKLLKLQILDVLFKSAPHKQANCSFEERKEIQKVMQIKNGETIKGSNILILDDVYTTGSSIDAAIKLIREFKPRKIEVLVLSKNIKKN